MQKKVCGLTEAGAPPTVIRIHRFHSPSRPTMRRWTQEVYQRSIIAKNHPIIQHRTPLQCCCRHQTGRKLYHRRRTIRRRNVHVKIRQHRRHAAAAVAVAAAMRAMQSTCPITMHNAIELYSIRVRTRAIIATRTVRWRAAVLGAADRRRVDTVTVDSIARKCGAGSIRGKRVMPMWTPTGILVAAVTIRRALVVRVPVCMQKPARRTMDETFHNRSPIVS